uniref:Uncharacterized protein n=1 Tax=Euplotes crassus TaxID=5936 RepID=A0A7S3NVT5_EUPCR|mmetsp:Transcript_36245/g.35849  ORF Transcript_36245/g.35849 Transcript_36245/m.35849 type:complete len:135 (+) Transcript_36245:59-463(+)
MRCRIEKIQNLRKDHNSLNLMMVEYENYIDHTPPPVCDYKLYRYKLYKMSVKKRLLLGISRLNRIIRSTQTYEIRELLHQAKVKAQMKHDHSETIRKNNILRRVPANDTQRNEKALLSLHVKIDKMADVIDVQK